MSWYKKYIIYFSDDAGAKTVDIFTTYNFQPTRYWRIFGNNKQSKRWQKYGLRWTSGCKESAKMT